MSFVKRGDHTWRLFFQRTISAQLHGVGALLVAAGACFLLPSAFHAGRAHGTATLAFLITGFLVFFTSSLYHFLHDGYSLSPALEDLFEKVDHTCIYLVIAGTYSPFILSVVSESWRGPLMGLVWAFALVGIFYTFARSRLPAVLQSRFVYTSLFVLMGWTLLIRAGEIVSRLSGAQLGLLLGGAAMYTVGAMVYALKRPNLWPGWFAFHELWHLMVVAGYVFHFFLVASFYG